jgi:hypothetical protein
MEFAWKFHESFFGQKNGFFLVNILWHHHALLFYTLFHKLILLDFEMSLHKTRKISEKMDKIDVQKWDRRNPFGKIRALLGVLRNFFGT